MTIEVSLISGILEIEEEEEVDRPSPFQFNCVSYTAISFILEGNEGVESMYLDNLFAIPSSVIEQAAKLWIKLSKISSESDLPTDGTRIAISRIISNLTNRRRKTIKMDMM